MKKQNLNKKLALNKKVISNFDANLISGGYRPTDPANGGGCISGFGGCAPLTPTTDTACNHK